ncbi:hypothetical protein [Rhodococcus globerulus]|uniref:hypothetical protein n=1 Tax=Rhodococcus globerulus TaxID=33008 RepID=UPI001FB0380B|nr:hypothetical protein [Rhodococcus globerulus]
MAISPRKTSTSATESGAKLNGLPVFVCTENEAASARSLMRSTIGGKGSAIGLPIYGPVMAQGYWGNYVASHYAPIDAGYCRRYDFTERRMSRHRTLAVQIEGLAIEDGEIPPPKIGMVLDFPLHFTELPAENIDAVTIRAVLIADGHPRSSSTRRRIHRAAGNGAGCYAVTGGRRRGEDFTRAPAT